MLSNLALLMFAIAAMILVPCMATYSDQAYRAQAVDLESRSTNQLRRLRAAQKTANIRSRSTDQPWLHDDVELHEMDGRLCLLGTPISVEDSLSIFHQTSTTKVDHYLPKSMRLPNCLCYLSRVLNRSSAMSNVMKLASSLALFRRNPSSEALVNCATQTHSL